MTASYLRIVIVNERSSDKTISHGILSFAMIQEIISDLEGKYKLSIRYLWYVQLSLVSKFYSAAMILIIAHNFDLGRCLTEKRVRK